VYAVTVERIPAGAPLASADAHPAATGVPVLDVQNLRVWFSLPQGTLRAVDGVTFRLFRGRSLGLIGESGSGKSMTARALLRLIPPPGWIASGLIQLCVNGVPIELTGLDALGEPMRTVRGGAIGMVFQDPASSLSPVRTLGGQMVEAIRAHRRLDRARGREAALDMLHRVGLRDPRRCFEAYPHQLSGGMCQRAVMALAQKDQRVLITRDADFTDSNTFPPSQSPGIIHVDIHPPRLAPIVASLKSLLAEVPESTLTGRLFVIDETGYGDFS